MRAPGRGAGGGARAAARGRATCRPQARDARYRLAERLAAADYAAAHTASDQAETVLYRLAVSPGRRALLGMDAAAGAAGAPAARGHPRGDARVLPRARPGLARGRVQRRPALRARACARERAPGAARALAGRRAHDRGDGAAAARRGRGARRRRGGGARRPGRRAGGGSSRALRALPPALARLVLRALAEDAAGAPRSLSRAEVDAVLALGTGRGGTAALDLGGGLRAVAEYGTLRFRRGGERAGARARRAARAGRRSVRRLGGRGRARRRARSRVAAARLEGALVVRAWRDGDRMRPVGLGGTKSLQDLFTDRKVPRALRRSLPVVESGGRDRVGGRRGARRALRRRPPARSRRDRSLGAARSSLPRA